MYRYTCYVHVVCHSWCLSFMTTNNAITSAIALILLVFIVGLSFVLVSIRPVH